ncbi:MAG: YicC/YloC family endoribonuclease [Candidatus Dependentiae bacterium]
MRSMTGFASKTATLHFKETKFHATVSIKSVNSRFFENTCKLPYALHHLETDITKILKKQLYRGHLFTSINLSDQSILKGNVTTSLPIVKSYLQSVSEIQKETGVAGTFTISDLIQLPYVFSTQEKLIDEEIKTQLINLVQETVTLLIAEEEREGSAMCTDLTERLDIAQKNIDAIEHHHAAFMKARKEQILKEIQTYTTEDDKVVETRKAALYYMLDKIDIHEEIVRFKSHLNRLHDLLASVNIEKGKRIDFTLQELTREINTIAAKASDAKMGSLAIDIKVELEKAREQTQNVV